MAGKWRARRAGLGKLLAVERLNDLCGTAQSSLDLLDAAAHQHSYRVDPAWRDGTKRGVFYGISHSLLSRTAYLEALSRHKDLKRVLFLHDTIPCDFPEFCREQEAQKHLLRLRNLFPYGTHIVVNSAYTAERMEFWRARLSGKELPVEIIPIGVGESVLGFAKASLSDSETLFVHAGSEIM